MYNLDFLPIAKQDMVETAYYISKILATPKAAERLTTELIESVEPLQDFPYANPIYIPVLRPLKHEYRRVVVRNYIILYWVNEQEKAVTIARVIYAKRNLTLLLK